MRPCLARTPPGEFYIRRARPSDAEALCALHVDSIRTCCRGHYTPEQLDAWCAGKDPAIYRRAMRANTMLVAERRRKIVGFGEIATDRGELLGLYLSPCAVGRGIGGAILARLQQAAVEAGRTEIRLRATVNATRFYERHGFTKTDDRAAFVLNGVELPCVPLMKTVATAANGSAAGDPMTNGAAGGPAVAGNGAATGNGAAAGDGAASGEAEGGGERDAANVVSP